MNKKFQTQWVAQFYVAAELTRRGYMVSLTLGNAPVADLLVVSPGDEHFMVDVKGLSSKNFWLVRERKVPESLFYVLAYLPPKFEPPQFFIFSGAILMSEVRALREKTVAAGKRWVENGAGINWSVALAHKDKWSALPK